MKTSATSADLHDVRSRASILRDVKSSTKKAPATKSLVVLGDNESGRTTLIARLQDNDEPKRGAGLEYHYIDVKDDDRDGTTPPFSLRSSVDFR